MIEYMIMFAIGMVSGGLIVWWFTGRNVRMYRVLWENEKAGNVLMLRRVAVLEDERMDLDEGDD